jgi:hypothetical protein
MAIPFQANHMMANGEKPSGIKKELVKYKDDIDEVVKLDIFKFSR